ncbi:head GIN domain-containing protein [Spongiimicrobium sp. 3-5]|uniref:head GIN domain-containing protein n=1 Tax=Spongiimicrobium sp. 3-5 TaxID=3332596 RepID=UPI00397EFEDA
MKKGIYILLFIMAAVFCACNGDNVPDCFQNSGELIREEVSITEFTKITVFENVKMVLRTGTEHLVEIETGEFLRDEVSATVEGDRLVLRDENDCNYVRDFGTTTIFVTAPNITEIRSSTGFPIISDGVLTYPNLNLLSESFIDATAETTDGEFDLELDSENVTLATNGIAFFKLSGITNNLGITIAAGDSRIAAETLTAQNVSIDHRGSNDILINPQQSLSGVVRGTGDVLSFNRPPAVDIEILFNGQLIFQE